MNATISLKWSHVKPLLQNHVFVLKDFMYNNLDNNAVQNQKRKCALQVMLTTTHPKQPRQISRQIGKEEPHVLPLEDKNHAKHQNPDRQRRPNRPKMRRRARSRIDAYHIHAKERRDETER